MAEEFGKEVSMVGLSVRGVLSVDDARKFATECVAAMGMQISHEATVVQYDPLNGEDIGFLLLQPLIESYVILDVWPCLGGFYINAVSCKDFDTVEIEELVARWGFKRMSISGGYLNL